MFIFKNRAVLNNKENVTKYLVSLVTTLHENDEIELDKRYGDGAIKML